MKRTIGEWGCCVATVDRHASRGDDGAALFYMAEVGSEMLLHLISLHTVSHRVSDRGRQRPVRVENERMV